jgi:hypothetical protein
MRVYDKEYDISVTYSYVNIIDSAAKTMAGFRPFCGTVKA